MLIPDPGRGQTTVVKGRRVPFGMLKVHMARSPEPPIGQARPSSEAFTSTGTNHKQDRPTPAKPQWMKTLSSQGLGNKTTEPSLL